MHLAILVLVMALFGWTMLPETRQGGEATRVEGGISSEWK